MLEREFVEFIDSHHVLNIATCTDNLSWCASCFYAYDEKNISFIFASDEKTLHMQNAIKNPNVSGAITLETKEVGKIEGLQFRGIVKKATTKEKALYLKTYPFALALNPTIWSIHVEYAKLTNNRFGIGVKKIFNRA